MVSGTASASRLAALCLSLIFSLPGTAPAEEKPWIAAPGKDRAWFRDHLKLVQRAKKDDIKLYFLGDSLTEHWTSTGRATWHLDILPQGGANFGLSADRIQNALFRIKKGELPNKSPAVFIVMLGTNNLAQKNPDSPEEVARGIKTILTQLKTRHPKSKILLLSILPNGNNPESPTRKSILATNKKLAKLADKKTVHFEDIHDQFLTAEGHWKPSLTSDHTHLTAAGYEFLYKTIKAPLKDLQAK